jgi:hypothetical protein
MARPSVRWAASDLISVRGGLGFFYTSINDTIRNFEFRPWQGLSVAWPKIGNQVFSQFFRFEERFTYRLDPWEQGFDFRFRYQLSTRIRLQKQKLSKYFYIPLAAELFFSTNSKLLDLTRNNARFTIGVGYVLNYRLTVEGRFVAQRSRLATGDFSVTDYIFRFMLRHSLYPIDPEEDELVH